MDTQNRNNIILIQTNKTETLIKYKMHPNNRELDSDAEVDTKSKKHLGIVPQLLFYQHCDATTQSP